MSEATTISEMHARVRAIGDDAQVIAMCLSPLVVMAMHAERLASQSVLVAKAKDVQGAFGHEFGDRTTAGAADALKAAREKIADAMEILGEYLNACDAVTPADEAFATPAFEALQLRAAGKLLDEPELAD